MKIGIYAALGGNISFEDKLRMISEAGYTVMCPSFTPFTSPKFDLPITKKDVVNLADKYGLEIASVHLSGDKMTTIWSETEDAEFVTQRAIDELAELKDLGMKTGVVHVTWGHSVPEAPSSGALSRFMRIGDAADKYQVQVAFENSVFPEHVHYVLENLQNPYVGFCYDSGHENAFTAGENYLDKYGHRLFAMHIHDNHGTDEHNLPFDGTIDWKRVMSQLRKTELFNRTGIMLETAERAPDYRAFLEQAYDVVKKLMTL